MIFCIRHPEREADFHCGHCEEGWCGDCAAERRFGAGSVRMCPACRNPLTPLAPLRPVEPFWRRLRHFFAFPFSREGWWMLFLAWLVMAIPLRLATIATRFLAAPPLIFYGMYFSLLATIFTIIVARAERGQMDLPASLDFEDYIHSLFRPIWNFFGAVVSAFWPMSIVPLLVFILLKFDVKSAFRVLASGPLLAVLALFFLFGLCLLPMSLLVVTITKNLKNVQNPLSLVREARKIPREYGIMLLVFNAVLAAYFGLRWLLLHFLAGSSFLGVIFYTLIDSELHLYLFLFYGHLLGYLAYQTRFKFKWWQATGEEPVFKVRGRELKLSWQYEPPPGFVPNRPAPRPGKAVGPAPDQGATPAPAPKLDLDIEDKVRERIEQATYLYEHGSNDQAAEAFKQVLELKPHSFGALRGMVMCARRLQDHGAMKHYARLVAQAMAGEGAFEALWDMHQDYQQDMPDFSFNPPELLALCDWLISRDQHLEAGRVLRELAVSYPDDPNAPEALYRCAQILINNCSQPETAHNILSALLKRYPDSDCAEKARQDLKKLTAHKSGPPEISG